MKRTHHYIGVIILIIMLIVAGTEWRPRVMAQDSNEDSLAVVDRLSDEFKRSGDIGALTSLTNLIHNEKFGPNALGTLTLLARKVTPKLAESLIIPALIGGLNDPVIATRREAAIALEEYSSYIVPVLPALTNFLYHSQYADKLMVDYFVIHALGRVGKKASPAIPALLRIVDWPDKDFANFGSLSPRVAAVAAINQIGFSDSAMRLRLERALNDTDPFVRGASASALIDNGFISQAALATLSQTIVPHNIEFMLTPVALQSVRDATSNTNSAIQDAARTLLKKLKK